MKVDSFIECIVKHDRFIAYFPQCSSSLFHLVAKHPKCDNYCLVEEGIGSAECAASAYSVCLNVFLMLAKNIGMLFRNPCNLLIWVLSKLRISPARTFIEPSYLKAYAISSFAYPGMPRTTQLNIKDIQSILTDHKRVPPYSWIYAFDASIEYGLLSEDLFFMGWKEMISVLARKGVDRLFVKLHPQQLENKNYLSRMQHLLLSISSGVDITYLESSVCIEMLALKTPINLITNISSLAMYVKILGQDSSSFSISKYFSDRSDGFRVIAQRQAAFSVSLFDNSF